VIDDRFGLLRFNYGRMKKGGRDNGGAISISHDRKKGDRRVIPLFPFLKQHEKGVKSVWV